MEVFNMRRNLAILITGLAITFGGAAVSEAGIVMTWEDVGGELVLSINGDWSDWESTTAMTESDDLLFGANSTTPWFFDLSRDGLGTTNMSGAPNGSSALLNVVSGSGSVAAPDLADLMSPIGTRYNLEYLNLGGSLALTAGVVSTETFFVDDTFNLGSTFSLTSGTRVFSNSNFPGGETLTMNFVTNAVPEPGSFAIFGIGFGLVVSSRRRRRGQ